MAEVKLSFRFVVVLYVFTAARLCYTDNSSNVDVQKLLNSLNKSPVKSIKSPDGDMIDCVRISDQPAFDHPLLKNHTIKMRPTYYPNGIKVDDTTMMNALKDEPSITQLWHSNGKCPKGTIPIRRIKKEDVLRASSIERYGKKESFVDAKLDTHRGPQLAIAYADNEEFYGTQALLNVWNPKVQENNEYSLGQTWIRGGSDSGINTIEAGWQVYQRLYGDTNSRFFIYWTRDGYKRTGCYNLVCSGFIQTNDKIVIGGSLSPISQMYGRQSELDILIWKDRKGGDWWMQVNGDLIGYWPSNLFTYLRRSASEVHWGGEVVNLASDGRHTTTEMGSGRFPQQGFSKATYIKKIKTVDESNILRSPDLLDTASENNCYDILTGFNDNWVATFSLVDQGGTNIASDRTGFSSTCNMFGKLYSM